MGNVSFGLSETASLDATTRHRNPGGGSKKGYGVMLQAANSNFAASLDQAVIGQAITIRQPHRKHGRCYAAFAGHVGDGKHILARKLIASMWRSRWTKPLPVARADVLGVHLHEAGAR